MRGVAFRKRLQYKNMKGDFMDKKSKEKKVQKKFQEEFNNITNKVKPENQNQEHNVRDEGIGPINQRR